MIVDELQNKETHNANSITYASLAVIPLRMLQYDSLMEYYFREPEHIYLKIKKEKRLVSNRYFGSSNIKPINR